MAKRRRYRTLASLGVMGTAALAAPAWACSPSASIRFPRSIQAPPAPPGGVVTIEGSQFHPPGSGFGPVQIMWNSLVGPPIASAAGLSFSVQVPIPTSAEPGFHAINAVQRSLADNSIAGRGTVVVEVLAPAESPPAPVVAPPAATVAPPAETVTVTPPAETVTPPAVTVTPPAETLTPSPAATVTPPAETVTPPAETVTPPAATVTPPGAPSADAVTPPAGTAPSGATAPPPAGAVTPPGGAPAADQGGRRDGSQPASGGSPVFGGLPRVFSGGQVSGGVGSAAGILQSSREGAGAGVPVVADGLSAPGLPASVAEAWAPSDSSAPSLFSPDEATDVPQSDRSSVGAGLVGVGLMAMVGIGVVAAQRRRLALASRISRR